VRDPEIMRNRALGGANSGVIEAMGGELETSPVFPEGSIRLKRFGEPTNSLS
jgi:hypothetical protein